MLSQHAAVAADASSLVPGEPRCCMLTDRVVCIYAERTLPRQRPDSAEEAEPRSCVHSHTATSGCVSTSHVSVVAPLLRIHRRDVGLKSIEGTHTSIQLRQISSSACLDCRFNSGVDNRCQMHMQAGHWQPRLELWLRIRRSDQYCTCSSSNA